MSAFLCDSYHTGRVAAYLGHIFGRSGSGFLSFWCPEIMARVERPVYPGVEHPDYPMDMTEAFAVFLAQANLDSLDARYGHSGGAGGFLDGQSPTEYIAECVAASRKPYLDYVWSDADMFEAMGCLDYQSCEHDGWHGSDAEHLLTRGRLEAGRRMAKRLGSEVYELRQPDNEPQVVSLMSLVK